MAIGSLTFSVAKTDKYLILSFQYPLDKMDGYEDLEAVLVSLQEQIDQIIEGTAGVISFNERLGHVVPEEGDYTAAQVGADAAGSAASVLSQLNTHKADEGDPHQTKADLQTFTASKVDVSLDTDDQARDVNGAEIFLGLEVSQSFAIGDVVRLAAELPVVTGSAGNAEVLFELIYDKGGLDEEVIASESIRVGNNVISFDVSMSVVIASDLATATIGLYGTAITGTTLVSNDVLEANMALERIRNFNFKAYAA